MTALGNSPLDNEVHLKRLQKTCEITLSRLLENAKDTCNLTSKLRSLPVPRDKRLELYLQKRKEDAALDAYQKARTQLLAAIEADPDRDIEAEVQPPKTHGTPRSGLHRRKAG